MKLLKSTSSLLTALVLALAMLIAPISSASAHDVPGSTLDTRNKGWIIDMFTYINEHRTNNGLNPLRFNATASEVAEDWAEETLRNGNPAHAGWTKSDSRVAGRTISTGENVAGEIIGNVDAKTIFLSWKNSPAHNAAMLQPDFEVIGLGFNHTPTGGMYAVTQFYTFKAGQEPAGSFESAAAYFETTGVLTLDPGTPFSVYENGGVRFYDLYENYTTAFELDGQRINDDYGTLSNAGHTLKLTPKAGYRFPDGARTTWTYQDIRESTFAMDPYFDPFIPEYTIPGEGCDQCKDVYYVNGKATAPGEYKVAAGTRLTITVKAPADADYKLTEPTTWTHAFPGTAKTIAKTLKASQPKITGTAKVGAPLMTQPGSWSPGSKLSYQWFANDTAIPKATGTTFTLSPIHRGKHITVRVTGSQTGYTTISKTSAPTTVGYGSLKASTPAVSGTPRVGTKLTTKAGSWSSATKLAYRWYANNKALKGATAKSYTPTAATKGKRLSVKVSGSKNGYTTKTLTKHLTTVKAGNLKHKKPKITGTKRLGKTLRAKAGTWTGGTKLSYQWRANGKIITGARSSRLKLTRHHIGKKISVQVTGTKAGYTTTKVASAKTAKIKRR